MHDSSPHDTPEIAALRESLVLVRDRAGSLDDSELSLLRERVCAVVAQLKSEGVLAEGVVIAIRRMATETRLTAASNGVMDKAIRWCIQEYYKAS